MDESELDFDLREVVGVLRRRGWIILGTIVVCVALALANASRLPSRYAATSQVRITDPNAEAVFNGVQIKSDPKREVETQIQVVLSSEIRDAANAILGDRATQVTNVSVTGQGETDILLIRAESQNPDVAKAASDALADSYVRIKRERLVSEFTKRAEELHKKSDALNEEITAIQATINLAPTGPDAETLRAQKSGIQSQKQELDRRAAEAEVEAQVRGGSVELVDHAPAPTAPFSPRPARDAVVAGALGLLLGLAAAFVFERLDDGVKYGEIESVTGGLAVLGVVPLRSGTRRHRKHLPSAPRAFVAPHSVESEAFRTLGTSLRFSNLSKAKKVLAVTSPSGSEGKSTLTANLAHSLADGGFAVVAVSADLRRPTLGQFFGLSDDGPGLTSVLIGDVSVAEVLERVPTTGSGHLLFLPAGPLPHNPAELLASPAMGKLLAGLAEGGADFVLIDCPPVLPVSDTLNLVPHVDGVVVVCVPGQTGRTPLATCIERLRTIGTEIVGVVANGFSDPSSGYGYGYAYSYAKADRDRAVPSGSGSSSSSTSPSRRNGSSRGTSDSRATDEVEAHR